MLLLLVGSQLPQACHWHTPGWIANFIILSLFLRTFSGHCSFLSQLWAALEQKPIETNAQIAQILQNLKLAWDSHNFTMLSFRKYSEPSYHPHLLGDFCDQLQINTYLSPKFASGAAKPKWLTQLLVTRDSLLKWLLCTSKGLFVQNISSSFQKWIRLGTHTV